MISISQAIMSLRPGAQWSMSGNDVEGITWHSPNVKPLTIAEVEAEMTKLQNQATESAAAQAAATQAAIAHAKSLGFTDEMIAVMYPNLAP